MSKIEELIAMKWGVAGNGTQVCTGEQGEGVIMADTETSLCLTLEESQAIAKHIVTIHNDDIDANQGMIDMGFIPTEKETEFIIE